MVDGAIGLRHHGRHCAGDLEQALIWVEWTQDFNSSVFTAKQANYYRCLQTLLLLTQEPDREAAQYYTAFVKMYGQEALDAAIARADHALLEGKLHGRDRVVVAQLAPQAVQGESSVVAVADMGEGFGIGCASIAKRPRAVRWPGAGGGAKMARQRPSGQEFELLKRIRP